MDKAAIIRAYEGGSKVSEIARLFGVSRQRIDQIVYPEKYNARQLAGYAVEKGAIKKLPCEVCGSPYSEAHHPDYSKPLEVKWLCKQHHNQIPRARHYQQYFGNSETMTSREISMNKNGDVIKQLKQLSLEAGSQAALAEKIGISASYVSDVIHGRREPGPAIIQYLKLIKVVTYEEQPSTGGEEQSSDEMAQ